MSSRKLKNQEKILENPVKFRKILKAVFLVGESDKSIIWNFYAWSSSPKSKKKTSAENIMQQVSLAQTERYADYSAYYTQTAGCTPTAATSRQVEKELLEGDGVKANIITEDIGFNICIEPSGTGSFNVIASDGQTPECKITLNGKNLAITRTGC